MAAGHDGGGHDVRMNVKVSRRDFPVLTEEIARLPKGPRRTNRLAHLATLGLLWEQAVGEGGSAARGFSAAANVAAAPAPSAAHTYRSRLGAGHLAALLDDDTAP